MIERGYFIFDGERSSDYGVFISAGMAFDSAEDEYTMLPIPGRSGDLYIGQNRFSNREAEYPAFIFAGSSYEFSKKLREFRRSIGAKKGYCRLSDSYNPDLFTLAVYKGGLEVEPVHFNRAGSFKIRFECKPQRFLLSGEAERTYTASGAIYNPTGFAAKPLIKVTGYGTIGIGDYTVTITGTASTVTYVDCDVMESYGITDGVKTSRNAYVNTGVYYPELKPGNNTITLGANISEAVITPRWWEI